MENKCNGCEYKKGKNNLTIPYFVHEGEMARSERHIKRLWIALIIAIVIAFVTNIGWLIYESQFESMTAEQDGSAINNVNLGEQGDIINESED